MPTAMPMSAVSRFMPAASSEPKVRTSTRTATTTPTNSVAPMCTPVVPNALPPTAVSRPASSAALVASCRASRLAGSSSSWLTVKSTVASAARPSGLTAELSNGLTTVSTCGAWPAAATTPLDRAGEGRVGHRGALGGDEDDLCVHAGRGRGGRIQLVEGGLRLGARDGEPVVERATDGDQQGDDGTEEGQPGHRDQAAVPVGGAAQPGEERAHGKGLRDRFVRVGRLLGKAGGAVGCAGRGRAQQEDQGGAFQGGGGPVVRPREADGGDDHAVVQRQDHAGQLIGGGGEGGSPPARGRPHWVRPGGGAGGR